MSAAKRPRLILGGFFLLCACPADLPTPRSCPELPCAAERQCDERVCNGELWVCLPDANGRFDWRVAPACTRDLGLPDSPPPPDAAPDITPDTTVHCGDNAEPDPAKPDGCACVQGYINQDGSWENGCEALDPDCSFTTCDHCPEGYCGDNTRCNENGKCRCIDRFWKNLDKDWSNGCEEPVTDCAWDNCNACYTGFCNDRAQCNMNKCTCIEEGWVNCNGDWESDGCECNGACVDGQCQ